MSTARGPKINYPSFDVYAAIARWLDDLEKAGKTLDSTLRAVDPRLVTRGDVYTLNVAIRTLVEKHNALEVRG